MLEADLERGGQLLYHHDTNFGRLVARERIEERRREADADRLAREARGTARRLVLPRLTGWRLGSVESRHGAASHYPRGSRV